MSGTKKGATLPEVSALRRATARRAKSRRAWRDAIVAAHTAGASIRVIGEAAGVSHVNVLQIMRAEAEPTKGA